MKMFEDGKNAEGAAKKKIADEEPCGRSGSGSGSGEESDATGSEGKSKGKTRREKYTRPSPKDLDRLRTRALEELEDVLPNGVLERYELLDTMSTIRGEVQCIRANDGESGKPVLLKVPLTLKGSQIVGRGILVVEGLQGNLDKDLKENGPMGIDETRAIAKDIFDALNDLHLNGLVHNDVRAVNVWFGDDGAKLSGMGLRDPSMSTSGKHRSPEVNDDVATPGQAVDMWAMGVLILEMLTGENVFPDEEVKRGRLQKRLAKTQGALDEFVSGKLNDVEEQVEGEKVGLKRLLIRLLDAKPEKRSTARGALRTAFLAPGARNKKDWNLEVDARKQPQRGCKKRSRDDVKGSTKQAKKSRA
ncbi:hypothetical protein BSKO_02098 [Bryopsis sp. KO-2023]|nr:hypothetical protein BSKO_02098 [Bryopsis sp. KO-2023]